MAAKKADFNLSHNYSTCHPPSPLAHWDEILSKNVPPFLSMNRSFQDKWYRGSPDSTNFGPPGDRTIAKIVLSGD